MVDGIKFNPFTGQVLTPEEIEKLDLNKNGIITQDELDQGMAWLSGGQDTDGEVQIGEQSPLTKAALKSGMSSSANNETEFKANIAILQDEFIEHFFKENTGLTSEERANIISLVSTATSSFVSLYLTEHPQGPYDMTDVASKYEINVKTSVDNNRKATDAVKASIDGYINNVDSNYDAMLSYANSALVDENDIVKGTEWNQVKNKAVQYLMGSLMSGNIDVDLLTNINPNYAKNSNYQEALKAINELKNCSDPAKMQELLTTAQQKLTAFLDAMGPEKVANGIKAAEEIKQDAEKAKEEVAITAELEKQVDLWVESKITKDMTPEEQTAIQNFAKNAIAKFIAELEENDRLDSANLANLIQEFNKNIETQYEAFTNIHDKMDSALSDTESTYNELVNKSDEAKGNNGYINNAEKAVIVDYASQFIVKQLLNGTTEIQLLASLDPNYKKSGDFVKLQGIISQLKTAADVDQIKNLGNEATELVAQILNKYSGNQLAAAVDSTKPIEINPDTKRDAIANSSISGEYQAAVSRTSSYGKQNSKSLAQIQEQAKKDLEAYAESLKAQLKSELGSAYNEAEIDKYIKDAMNDTIALFTENARRRQPSDYPKAGKYTTASDEFAFVFQRRHGTKKGRYCYNVQALIDAFTTKFNETAKTKHAAKIDPSNATYDRENVIADTLGNAYLRNEKIDYKDTTENRAKAINEAKSILLTLVPAIKASLIAEGCKLPSSTIDSILDEALNSSINDITDLISTYEKKRSWAGIGFLKKNQDRFSISKADLADSFMNKVDELLDKAKGKKPEETDETK